MQSFKRSTRVAELLQQHISKIIQEMNNSEMGFVTVTGIKLTDDLLDARVYYSVLGSDEQVLNTQNILNESIPEIRHQIAVRLNLRRTPTLIFDLDTTAERATKVFELLARIKSGEEHPAESETSVTAEKTPNKSAVKPKKPSKNK